MKSGLWLAILFNVAAVAILAVVTIMGGNGAASRNPYASSVQPPSAPIAVELSPDRPATPTLIRIPASNHVTGAPDEAAWRRDLTPDATPVPWVDMPDGTVRLQP